MLCVKISAWNNQAKDIPVCCWNRYKKGKYDCSEPGCWNHVFQHPPADLSQPLWPSSPPEKWSSSRSKKATQKVYSSLFFFHTSTHTRQLINRCPGTTWTLVKWGREKAVAWFVFNFSGGVCPSPFFFLVLLYMRAGFCRLTFCSLDGGKQICKNTKNNFYPQILTTSTFEFLPHKIQHLHPCASITKQNEQTKNKPYNLYVP